MEITDIKKHIKSGEFQKIYIFYGEECAIIKLYLKMMAEKGNLLLTYADSVIDLVTGTRTNALVSERHLYVVMDDKEYLTNEKMWEKFKGLKDDVVVLYYTNADKRLKFWKQNKDRAVEFTKLEPAILTKYIKKEVSLSDALCDELIDVCNQDYGRILLEIDKLKAYCIAEGMEENCALEVLLADNVIYREPKDAIFMFVDAVLARNPAKAYDLLQQSKAVGEANMVLISVLYNNIKTLLQVQSGKDWKSLGLTWFAVNNVQKHKNNYSNGELVKAMKLLREIEVGIKTGKIPDELSIEYFLVQIM